jgi:hypothetical protein
MCSEVIAMTSMNEHECMRSELREKDNNYWKHEQIKQRAEKTCGNKRNNNESPPSGTACFHNDWLKTLGRILLRYPSSS